MDQEGQTLPKRSEVLPALTAMRFPLAMWVVFYHLGQKQMEGAPQWASKITSHGYVAVNAFFILSGFILAHNYTGMKSVKEFWIARFARIFPLYCLAIFLGLPNRHEYVSTHPSGWGDLAACVSAITMTQAWTPYALLINSAAWSISAEAFFYLLFPVLIQLTADKSRGETYGLIAITYLGAIALPLAALWSPDLAVIADVTRYNPLVHLPAFIMGMATYRLFALKGPLPTWLCLLPTGAIIWLVSSDLPITRSLYQNGVLGLLFAILILTLAKPMSLGKPLVRLGDASYSIYLLHLPLPGLIATINKAYWRLSVDSWPYLSVSVLTTICVSLVTFSYVEVPYRSAILSWFRKASAPKSAAARTA